MTCSLIMSYKHSPKWKRYTFIMAFTMHEKKVHPPPPHGGREIQSFVRVLNWKFVKKSNKNSHMLLMDPTVYSIQREVNKEFESFSVLIYVSLNWKQNEYLFFTINWVLDKLSAFTIWVTSLLCIINDFKIKAVCFFCNVSYFKDIALILC